MLCRTILHYRALDDCPFSGCFPCDSLAVASNEKDWSERVLGVAPKRPRTVSNPVTEMAHPQLVGFESRLVKSGKRV